MNIPIARLKQKAIAYLTNHGLNARDAQTLMKQKFSEVLEQA